jgi:hypothetical protein
MQLAIKLQVLQVCWNSMKTKLIGKIIEMMAKLGEKQCTDIVFYGIPFFAFCFCSNFTFFVGS